MLVVTLEPILHPRWGSVEPMREFTRATHVWQHLYNPAERWDGLAGANIQELRSLAERRGCPPPPSTPYGSRARPRLPCVPGPCHALLREHHDAYYGPAYLRELAEPQTEWGIQHRRSGNLMCCTPRGVLVAVEYRQPRSVLTAFRPDLPFDGPTDANTSDSTYHQIARERWEGATMRDGSVWKEGLLRALEDAGAQPPRHTEEAWRLVRAIGHARALVDREPAVAALLSAAEVVLDRHRRDIARLLEGKLRTDALLAGLESALEAEEPDQVEDRLLAIADVLVVLEVLKDASGLKRLQGVADLLSRTWPPGMTGFDRLAHARLDAASPAVRTLWEAVLRAQAASGLDPGPAPLAERVRRILGVFSLAQALPAAAAASSGIELGPPPVQLARRGERALVLTLAQDLQTVVLQVSGLGPGEVPQGTRDGAALSFTRDEFGAWLAPALPGEHRITLGEEVLEFTLSS